MDDGQDLAAERPTQPCHHPGGGADTATRRRVLVVDDDVTVRDVVRRYLERAGMRVFLAGDGETALRIVAAEQPDLVVLDLMLPGVDGIEVCARIRRDSALPVLMLTALGEEHDRVLGLEVGADDYVTKPFSPRELTLRVLSILRRTEAQHVTGPRPPAAVRRLVDGDLSVDLDARRGELAGRDLTLTTREFDLLAFLLQNPDTAFTRTQLLDRVWGWNFGDHSTVTVHVRRLREKIEPTPTKPRRIVTVWGVGYRYEEARG
ncbi:response regulator transcription factor [Actinopolymorpha pittospori]|uniref:DNA-binding response OmpR family regulator n=1 Tax=Actinopolymorpha pittospori TaxID=648752 RepID=A0A927MVL5_9ACTN|nr:response regulator transcription factor [Actinopolymorpha pittospori]MBE1606068.1 DNA-binding response OmpR family regulator [Actinopolymorpha pittospori]